jgi:hypothetical protein
MLHAGGGMIDAISSNWWRMARRFGPVIASWRVMTAIPWLLARSLSGRAIFAHAASIQPDPMSAGIFNPVHRASVPNGGMILKHVPDLPISISMDPIKGTDVSLAIAKIALQAKENAEKIGTATMKLALDNMRDTGQQLVDMMEGLGQNIDTYA